MKKMGVIVKHLAMELDNGKAEAQGGRDATLQLRKELFAVRGTLSSDSISWMDFRAQTGTPEDASRALQAG